MEKEYKQSSIRSKKRKCQFDEGLSPETVFSRRQNFKIDVFLIIIDKLSSALQHRLDAYKDIHENFGFLTNLTVLSNDTIRGAAAKLMEEYSSDFEDCFSSELVQFSELFKKCIAQPQAQGQEKEVAQCENQNTCTS